MVKFQVFLKLGFSFIWFLVLSLSLEFFYLGSGCCEYYSEMPPCSVIEISNTVMFLETIQTFQNINPQNQRAIDRAAFRLSALFVVRDSEH